jgi:hypothetical protein
VLAVEHCVNVAEPDDPAVVVIVRMRMKRPQW